jgi:NhaP-type Na+/H+ or K+/H+ antiporter
MCSLLCSSDVVAAVSLINSSEQPKLFAVVFGEGVTNDAVSIILFNTVIKTFTTPSDAGTFQQGVNILFDFCWLGIASVLVGIAYAVAASLLIKYFHSLTRDAVVECAMILLHGYLAYVTAEILELSGIIALLTAGVVMA